MFYNLFDGKSWKRGALINQHNFRVLALRRNLQNTHSGADIFQIVFCKHFISRNSAINTPPIHHGIIPDNDETSNPLLGVELLTKKPRRRINF